MTNKEAAFLLGAYRPGGHDAGDPEFAEALRLAASDPQTKGWMEEERKFDTAIAARVQGIAVPEDLRTRILAGGRVSVRPAPWWSGRRLLAMAAMLAMFAGLGIWYTMYERESGQWEDRALDALGELVAGRENFDMRSASVGDLQQWLHHNGSPSTAALPEKLHGMPSLGCKTLSWQGHPISIICFHGPGGELVHLAMVHKSSLHNPPPEGRPEFEERDGWRMACWSQGDMAMMLVTRGPESQLRAILAIVALL
jgi:hypothetical protein